MGVMVKNKVARFFMDHGVYLLYPNVGIFKYRSLQSTPQCVLFVMTSQSVYCEHFGFQFRQYHIYSRNMHLDYVLKLGLGR